MFLSALRSAIRRFRAPSVSSSRTPTVIRAPKVLSARRIELSHADFCVWRGIELSAFRHYTGAFLPDAKICVERGLRVHNLTLAQLNAREQIEVTHAAAN